MRNISKNISLDNIPSKEKFKTCHRNRGMNIYTFYAYSQQIRDRKPEDLN